jgi:valyl-tRNA synthetase
MQITPAHDTEDFKAGKRHNLEFINIFTDDGNINENGGLQFEGMARFTARAAVIDALKAKVLVKYSDLPFSLQLILWCSCGVNFYAILLLIFNVIMLWKRCVNLC